MGIFKKRSYILIEREDRIDDLHGTGKIKVINMRISLAADLVADTYGDLTKSIGLTYEQALHYAKAHLRAAYGLPEEEEEA